MTKQQRILRNFLITCLFAGIATAGVGWMIISNTPSGNLTSRLACGWFLMGRDYARDKTLQVGSRRYYLESAAKTDQQIRGLSNEKCLPANAGKLLIFSEPGERCIWMKDMRFDLDIIWLDDHKIINHIEKNVMPQSYPHSYCGNGPAAYVLEVNSGTAEAVRLKAGEKLHF